MRAAAALAVAALAGGCAMRVGPVQTRPPRPETFVPPMQTATLAASADAVIAVQPDWDPRPLGDEPWVMVGSSAEGGRWMSLLRFEIEPLVWRDPNVALDSVELVLPVRPDPPQPYPMRDVRVGVFVVVDPWVESTVEWSSRPWVFDREQATLQFYGSDTLTDRVDVTQLVQNALSSGQTSIELALVVTEAAAPFRRIWSARESVADPSGTSAGLVPHLQVSWSEDSAPRSAAQRSAR